MSIGAIEVTAPGLVRTAPCPCSVFERKLFARAESLTMIIVTVLPGLALSSEMVAVAHLPLLSAFKQALLSASIGFWQVSIEALIVLVQDNVLPID